MLNVKGLLTKITTWIDRDVSPKVLWSGGAYMTSGQTANLSETVSSQHHGIVLVWSAYVSGEAKNYDWFYYFIPKYHVTNLAGQGIDMGLMANPTLSRVGTKYVYVSNDRITGYADNVSTGTSTSGVTRTNNYWVLRYVLGV